MDNVESKEKLSSANVRGPKIHVATVDAQIQGRRRKPKPGIRAFVSVAKGADEPLVLSKRKTGRDFSPFIPTFGLKFVLGAVDCIRAKRPDMAATTWWMNVERLEEVLAALATYAPKSAFSDGQLRLSEQSAASIELAYLADIEAQALTDKTKIVSIYRANVVFSYLAQRGLVNRRLELDTGANADRAPFGKPKQPASLMKGPPPPTNVPPHRLNFVARGHEHHYERFKSLGEAFMTAVVAERFEFSRSHGLVVGIQAKQTLRHFLGFLLTRKRAGVNLAFFEKLGGENFREVSERDWHSEIGLWREHLRRDSEQQELKPITPHRHFKRLTKTLDGLSSKGILPAVSIKGIKGAKSLNNLTPRKNLAQVSPKRQQAVESLVADMRLDFENLEDTQQSVAYLNALCDTLPAEAVANLTISEISDAIKKLNHERLLELRRCAEDEFIKWFDHWRTGESARTAPGVLEGAEMLPQLDEDVRLASEVRKSSVQLFYSGTPERQLGNLLNYVWARVGGIATGRFGRWDHLQTRFGGRSTVKAYLHAHPYATTALWVMLLVDSGGNAEVCRETPWDCLTAKKGGRVTLTLGTKKRAKGKQITVELSEAPMHGERISTVQAIHAYRQMFARHRALAPKNTQGFLLLTVPQSKVKLLTEYNARDWFKLLVARNPAFKELSLLPSMVRPSRLLDAHMHQGLPQAQALGDHASPITTLVNYTGQLPVNARYSLLMRTFTDRFEAIAASSIQDAATKLHIDPVVFEQRLREAGATGLGGLSLIPRHAEKGHEAGQAEPFPMTTRYVVATDEFIAELIGIHEQLSREHCQMAEPARDSWESKWLAWLIFSEVAIAKLSAGETAADFLRIRGALQSSQGNGA